MPIHSIISRSFRDASRALVMGTSPPALARARERAFVKILVDHFQSTYADEDIRIFSQFGRGNLQDFGAEQLLCDISICRIGSGRTGERKGREFLYVVDALVQVEIELSCEWQREIQALNRLISVSAAEKLLVASLPGRGSAESLKTLAAPFAAIPGAASLALIPHPSEWDTGEAEPEIWQLIDGEWHEAT